MFLYKKLKSCICYIINWRFTQKETFRDVQQCRSTTVLKYISAKIEIVFNCTENWGTLKMLSSDTNCWQFVWILFCLKWKREKQSHFAELIFCLWPQACGIFVCLTSGTNWKSQFCLLNWRTDSSAKDNSANLKLRQFSQKYTNNSAWDNSTSFTKR